MSSSELNRTLGFRDAVAIGIASMVGAGVFAVWGPAASAAGGWLVAGLVIAAVVAWANATSSAQLAAQYPSAGGTYVYGRERLGPWPGYVAGWSFVVGKTASCAAMALAFAAYVAPDGWHTVVAIGIVWVLVAVNCLGVTRTAQAAKVLVVLSLTGIATAVAFGWSGPPGSVSSGWSEPAGGVYGVLQSAGLLFFAFAGYARIATMGEEVRDPQVTIRRAITTALAVVLVVYAVVAATLLTRIDTLAGSTAPLLDLVAGQPVLRVVVIVAAAAAIAGALLGLLSGIGRTWLAMARERDLPAFFDHTHPATRVPHRIEITVGVILTVILLVADLRGAIGFSSFGVLLYYFIANVSAYTQEGHRRRYRRAWQVVGAVLCLTLVVTLPWQSVLGGIVVVGVGLAWRLLRPAALR